MAPVPLEFDGFGKGILCIEKENVGIFEKVDDGFEAFRSQALPGKNKKITANAPANDQSQFLEVAGWRLGVGVWRLGF